MKKQFLLVVTCGLTWVSAVFAFDASTVVYRQTGEMQTVSQYAAPSLQCSRNQSGKQGSVVSEDKIRSVQVKKSVVAARSAEADFSAITAN
jgi:hypothetical protein